MKPSNYSYILNRFLGFQNNDRYMKFVTEKYQQSGALYIASAFFIFFWASGFIAAKFGLPYAAPLTFLSLRFGLALIILVGICCIWPFRWPTKLSLNFHIIVAGLLIQTTYLIGVFYGIYLGLSTGIMALVVGLQPIITGCFASMMLGEKLIYKQWAGLGLGFLGLSLVVAEQIDLSGQTLWGTLFAVLALSGITIGTIYQKHYCVGVDIRAAVTIQNAVSFLLAGILAFLFEPLEVNWNMSFFLALSWSAVGLSVIAIALYFFLVQRGATAKVTSLIYLSPPTTALMGWLMFEETFTTLALFGLVLAVIGVAIVNRSV